jgi:Arc/MetJ-type ribon-helix-helix transcriptional regulator
MYDLCMSNNSKAINITLPHELLREIDKAAKRNYASRSDFIRESVVRQLRGLRVVDEWGDDGHWETVVDFREINPKGVPAEEVLATLQKLNRTDEQNRKTPKKAQR